MSVLHSSRAPWFILLLFIAAAAIFFLLAAGRDLGLVQEAVGPDQKTTVIRQAIIRGEQKVLQIERNALKGIGEALEHAGRKLEDAAVKVPEKEASATKAAEKPPADDPGKVMSHSFSLTDKGFRAVFRTDRAVPDPKVFFIPSPARWVVDIPGLWRNTARFNNRIDEGFISRVVLGEHEDYLRVVFHFRDTGLNRPKPPGVINEKSGFIILLPVSE